MEQRLEGSPGSTTKSGLVGSSGNSFGLLNAALSESALDAQSKMQQPDTGTNWADPDNFLFRNLMKHPNFSAVITQQENGSFVVSDRGSKLVDEQLRLAVLMVDGQNGVNVGGQIPGVPGSGIDPSGVFQFSSNDMAKFKQLTGYNLVMVGGMGAVAVDDFGNPPAGKDATKVASMLNVFDLASGLRGPGTPETDLSEAALKQAAMLLMLPDGSNMDLIDELLSLFDKKSSEESEQIAKQVLPEF